MFQCYYQAHLYGGAFLQPTLSYIPTPGTSSSLSGAWVATVRRRSWFTRLPGRARIAST
ncbi:MAG: hypothetical protein WCG76_09590 [Verrucomicrobiota bacterium]